MKIEGYQPTERTLDRSNPPKGGSGVPRNTLTVKIEDTVTYTQDEVYWTTESMIRVGGGFVKQLGELIRKGDLTNQRILINAFPEYWKTYTQIGINKRKQWQAEE